MANASDAFGTTADYLAYSVVICTHSRPAALRQALQALSLQTLPPTEIVIVENGEKDASTESLAQEFGARFLRTPEQGLSLARNLGLLASSGDIVAFIDDDCVPDKDWLLSMARGFHDPRTMAAGGRIVPPESDEQSLALCVSIQGTGSLQPQELDRQDKDWFAKAAFAKLGTGGNIAFRRKLIAAWPGFDERLGLPHSSCEDLYAFLTIVEAGHRVAYVPEAIVVHPCPMPRMDELRERVAKSAAEAGGYFMFLFFETSKYRWELLKFAARAVRKRMRASTTQQTSFGPDQNSSSRIPRAMMGAYEYFRKRFSAESQERAFRTSW